MMNKEGVMVSASWGCCCISFLDRIRHLDEFGI
jgi:hypothetical protein